MVNGSLYNEEWSKLNWTLYYLCVGLSIREIVRKLNISRRYTENINRKIVIPIRSILSNDEIKEVTKKLLVEKNISSLLKVLLEKVIEKTDEPLYIYVAKTAVSLLEQYWVTPDVILGLISLINLKVTDEIRGIVSLFLQSLTKQDFYSLVGLSQQLSEITSIMQEYVRYMPTAHLARCPRAT